MENRFEPNPQEQGWGAYVAPPVYGPSQTGLCTNVRGMLPDLLENDGTVRPEMATAIFGHLAVCPDCAREYDEMQRVVTHLEALPLAEPPIDYSGLIIRRIQTQTETVRSMSQADSSAMVTEQEIVRAKPAMNGDKNITDSTSKSNSNSMGATGVIQSQASSVQRLETARRLTLGVALSAVVAFFVSSAWGRQMLGVDVTAATEWLGQIGDIIRRVPLIGWIVGLILSILARTGGLLEETYHTLGATAVQGLIVDVALGALACYFMARRQRVQRLGA